MTDLVSHVILGLGHTGYSVLEYFIAQGHSQEALMVCDTRENPPYQTQVKEHFPKVTLHCGKAFDPGLLLQAEHIIVSPGLSLHDPAIQTASQKGIPVIGDVELFARARVPTAKLAVITGTNAKGTVTTMLAAMAEKAGLKVMVGGNIGIPALKLLSEPTPDLYVLELSSFQLESTYSLKPTVATILNVSPDHLDHHLDMSEYILAKQRIYLGAEQCVFNRADEATWPVNLNSPPEEGWHAKRDGVVDSNGGKLLSFALNATSSPQDFGTLTHESELWLVQGDERLMPTKELTMPGSHNIENALAALALAAALDLPREACLQALREYKGLAHRCQFVANKKGVRWYNDSKATNIGATMAALKGFQTDRHRKLFLIAGGDAKGTDLSILAPLIQEGVQAAFVYGKDREEILRAWQGACELVSVTDLPEAVLKASQVAHSGDVVLLSPACSSLDGFKNFEERGEVFVKLVRALEE